MPPRLAFIYVLRGLGLWVGVHAVAQLGGKVATEGDGPPDIGYIAPLLVTAALALVDTWRRRETLLLANMGLHWGVAALLMTLAAGAAELLLTVVRRAA